MKTSTPLPEKRSIEPTKPVELWTFRLALLSAFFFLVQGIFVTLPAFNLDQRQKQVAVDKSESESVSLVGHWLSPENCILVSNTYVSISPVFIDIENKGEIPVHVRKIEFRIFTAPLGEVAAVKQSSAERLKSVAPDVSSPIERMIL